MFSRELIASRRRRLSAVARLLGLVGVAALVLGFSYTGVGAPAGSRAVEFSSGLPPGGGSVSVNLTVNLTDAPSFAPNAVTSPPNGQIHFTLVNTGAINHTFTVSGVRNF
ncbi:MAG: hypothetical protein L3J91_03640, partial [Thermoplasmata archaeon]|nr:hypothetical protein [Thermoplasmata archaeon]